MQYRCPICPTHQLEHKVSYGFTGGSIQYMSCGHIFGLGSGAYFKKDKFESFENDENLLLNVAINQITTRPDWPIEADCIPVTLAIAQLTWLKEEDKEYLSDNYWYDGSYFPRRRLNDNLPRTDMGGRINEEVFDKQSIRTNKK